MGAPETECFGCMAVLRVYCEPFSGPTKQGKIQGTAQISEAMSCQDWLLERILSDWPL